jgi:hypothetical protein
MRRWRFAWLGVLYEMMAFEIRYHAPNKTLARTRADFDIVGLPAKRFLPDCRSRGATPT